MKRTSLVKGKQKYLYLAVDSTGQTLDFLLTAKRDAQAAKRFFRKAMKAIHTQSPRVINVDKNAAYPKVIAELKEKEELPELVELRQNKYLNNIASARPSSHKTISQTRDGMQGRSIRQDEQ